VLVNKLKSSDEIELNGFYLKDTTQSPAIYTTMTQCSCWVT